MADKKFIEETLKSHNEYRKKHGQGSLKLNKVSFYFLLDLLHMKQMFKYKLNYL